MLRVLAIIALSPLYLGFAIYNWLSEQSWWPFAYSDYDMRRGVDRIWHKDGRYEERIVNPKRIEHE